jgi:hypothetical protein
MLERVAAAGLIGITIVSAASGQTRKAPGTKSVTHEITIVADTTYTGTMDMAVDRGKVTGNLHLTTPTDITGKVAGTAKDGVLVLDFPFHMTERNCDGQVKMNIPLPAKRGPANGTMEAVGCGRDVDDPLPGTVELKPVRPTKKSR